MDYKIAIYSLDNHCLQLPVKESELKETYALISDGLVNAKKKGSFFEFEHVEHPFICNPEHVQSVTIMRIDPSQPASEPVQEVQNG